MRKFTITVNGVPYKVEVEEEGVIDSIKPVAKTVSEKPKIEKTTTVKTEKKEPEAVKQVAVQASNGESTVNAPMPGKIIQVKVNVGDKVQKGDVLVILEAMKMQNEIKTANDGTIKAINVTAGQSVKPGEAMVIIG